MDAAASTLFGFDVPQTPRLSPSPGTSPDHPIPLAGGVIFAGFNQRWYLHWLRGPSGEPLEHERIGTAQNQAGHIVDIYRVSWAGRAEPVHLCLDAYAPGPPGIPEGFTWASPDPPLELPSSIVPSDPSAAPPADADAPRAWRIVGETGDTMGYVSWDVATGLSVDMPKNTGELLQARLDEFVSRTPEAYMGPVLADVLERFVPWESRGIVKGVPMTVAQEQPEWSGPVWGDDAPEPDRGRRRRWGRGKPAS